MNGIHPTAIIHPDAKIEKGVTIDAFAVIHSPHVTLKEGVVVKSHVYLDGHVTVGKGTTIWPFASIGTRTQDLKYRGETTYIEIGEQCQIREYVTINGSCGEGSKVIVGNQCLIMAYCHVAHNCILGNGVIMSNGATLAGHVQVGDCAILGGLCAIHQRTRIGAYAMVGGGSMVGQDVPPYTIGSGYPLKVVGLNIVGLKRRQFPLAVRKDLIRLYRLTYQSELPWKEAREQIVAEFGLPSHVERWVDFCDHSERGLSPPRNRHGSKRALRPAEFVHELTQEV